MSKEKISSRVTENTLSVPSAEEFMNRHPDSKRV